jgi:hypothetical protein
MKHDSLAEVALELTVVGEALQTTLQALVDDPRPVRDLSSVVLGEWDGECVGLDLARQLHLDRDLVHGPRIVPKQGRGSARAGIYGAFTKFG